jgi:hypothetical protein
MYTCWHIIFKLQKPKVKEKFLKEAREMKHLTYSGMNVKIVLDF